MRITCPNCLAQYEIEAELLSAEGRDVQCSACDHVWFQAAPQRKGFRAPPPPDMDAGPKTDETPQQAAPATAPEAEATVAPLPDMAQDTTASDPVAAPPSVQAGLRQLDPSISAILQEEARFAQEAQQRERDQVEIQPDLGLLGGSPWPAAARAEKTLGAPVESPDARSPAPSAFPDIDDVSATLEPLGKRAQLGSDGYDVPQTARQRQRSFLSGFLVPLALGLVLVALYLLGPLLAAAVPALAPVIDSYLQAIDGLRTALASGFGGE